MAYHDLGNVGKKQLMLFGEELKPQVKKVRSGGSANPIVFRDYESYLAKFRNNAEKTTDDTYTPKDVYEAVADYVRSIYDMEGKVILRPFYPGGDYENAEYPENGVVIDNPPFSIFTKICKFYSSAGIPFFLFGPGMTIMSVLKFCSVVIVGKNIKFENGAKISCNFATNLIGDIAVTTSVKLTQAILRCDSQDKPSRLSLYETPPELLSVSDFQTIASGDYDLHILKNECVPTKYLDRHPKGLFGDHIIVSSELARKAAARKAAARKAAARKAVKIEFSEREKRIVENMNKEYQNDELQCKPNPHIRSQEL